MLQKSERRQPYYKCGTGDSQYYKYENGDSQYYKNTRMRVLLFQGRLGTVTRHLSFCEGRVGGVMLHVSLFAGRLEGVTRASLCLQAGWRPGCGTSPAPIKHVSNMIVLVAPGLRHVSNTSKTCL